MTMPVTPSDVLTATGINIVVNGGQTVVEPTDLSLGEGEIFGLVGESGSGKTTLGLATMGYTRSGLQLVSGTVRITGSQDDRKLPISYVPQNPGTALNPALLLRTQLAEALPEATRTKSRQKQQSALLQLLADVKLPADVAFLDQYPHQLSGGQQQRVCIAMAFAGRPRVVVMDEPTTGLDVTTQRHILEMVEQLCSRYRAAILYISHDLAVVAALCTRIAVMQNGRIVEQGPSAEVLRNPSHAYTKQLLRAVPEFDPARIHDAGAQANERLGTAPRPVALTVKSLSASYGDFPVIADLSLNVPSGECLALVGESGSGKTTLARCLAGLHAKMQGEVRLGNDLLSSEARLRSPDQRRRIQYIFQNPYTAFNPKRNIGGSLLAALNVFNGGTRRDDQAVVEDTMRQVALDPGLLRRYPHQLSGGQRQRAAIARALIARPEIMICDEITSALDVSVQSVIVDLLDKLRREQALTLLFVTHNMALVRNFAQRVAVLHKGAVVDHGTVEQVFTEPRAEETRRLIRDTPVFIAPPGLKASPAQAHAS
jgi:peptide/nickel transport system ATP-binding protein